MKIYGAGLAGLIAGHMLRRYEPTIHEAQPSLPNNHEAVLRFQSEAVSIATGIPFKRVRVFKQVVYNGESVDSTLPLFMANEYSLKVTGRVLNRSIVNTEPVDRWIAPSDFVQQLSRGLDIQYSSKLTKQKLFDPGVKISTIPMPALLNLMEDLSKHDDEIPPITPLAQNFDYQPTWTLSMDIDNPQVDVYQTIYFPDPDLSCYRATLTGSRLIIECIDDPSDYTNIDIRGLLKWFGIRNYTSSNRKVKRMPYGKIAPINEGIRRSIIRLATDGHDCYSLGRFATWRQILLDDIVQDVRVIDQLINSDSYTRSLVEAK